MEKYELTKTVLESTQCIKHVVFAAAIRTEYSISLPGCDVATLQLALRLLYTGDVQQLADSADWHRVMDVCTSLGVNLTGLSIAARNQCVALLLPANKYFN